MAQETTTRLGLCILVIVPVLLPQRGAFCAEPITIRCVNDSSLAITKKIIAKLGNSNPKLAQRIDAASWGYGAFHRFADGKCHILVHRRFPTPAEQKYIGWHLKGGLPKKYVLGQHRVLVIVNVANGISEISTGQIFKILAAGKEPPNWSDLGGTSTSKVRCYGESSKARSYVILREKCLRQESKGEVSYREIRKVNFTGKTLYKKEVSVI